ncbi:hypothetical protein HDU99_001265 [Rhizoclosmatium hyalinum]|nr:hypothetical protein HDU99_001265 [Rhizoclosmatium hyalinum]
MMKNRASADESRKKHKEHVEKLENAVRELVEENRILKQRVLEVEAWAMSLGSSGSVSASSSVGNSPVQNSMNGDSDTEKGLFDLFFGGEFVLGGSADGPLGSSQGKKMGTVFMAVFFSISLFMFPSAFFRPTATTSAPHFLPVNTHTRGDLVPTSSIMNGISNYIPRVFWPSPPPSATTSKTPALPGRPEIPLLDGSNGLLHRAKNGIVALYTPPVPATKPPSTSHPHPDYTSHRIHVSVDGYPELDAPIPFLTISAIEGWVLAPPTTTSEQPVCQFSELFAQVLKETATRGSGSTTVTVPTRTEQRVSVLKRLLGPTPTTTATTTTTAAVLRVSKDDGDVVVVVGDEDVGGDEKVVVEEVDTVLPGPIRRDEERASVQRRRLAREAAASRAAAALVPSLQHTQQVLGGGAASVAGKVVGGEYCSVKGGPVLSIVADLGGEEEDKVGEGYRLMLDVQVVGAKLVRY